jgi:hypothetical protein
VKDFDTIFSTQIQVRRRITLDKSLAELGRKSCGRSVVAAEISLAQQRGVLIQAGEQRARKRNKCMKYGTGMNDEVREHVNIWSEVKQKTIALRKYIVVEWKVKDKAAKPRFYCHAQHQLSSQFMTSNKW